MQIVLVGPGCMPIPSPGWGAVERIIWDYYEILTNKGYNVKIINKPNQIDIIKECNSIKPDIIHIMYDDHISIIPHIAGKLKCKKIIYTSHFAYLTSPELETTHNCYFKNIFMKVIEYGKIYTFFINAISTEIRNLYSRYGFPQERINIIRNGARDDLFQYISQKDIQDTQSMKSVYVGKIEMRKAQYKYQSLNNIDFIGNYHDSPFNIKNTNYLGEWTKDKLYSKLTDYANIILLSKGDADPLVIKEGLIAGLGVVVSECASANLDLTLPWITVIPDAELDNLEYINKKIDENRIISIANREQIRQYALANFSWSRIIKDYIELLLY